MRWLRDEGKDKTKMSVILTLAGPQLALRKTPPRIQGSAKPG